MDRLPSTRYRFGCYDLAPARGTKLMINSGTMYGSGGEGFIRLNIACPRTLLVEGLERMARVLEQNEE